MDTIGFTNFIENLRYARGMSQEEFLHDVISIRQYQRYRNGTSEISMDCIERMSNKLGIETRKLLADFQHEKFREKELVEEYYNSVVYKKNEDIQRLEQYFNNYNFLDKTNYEVHILASILNQYLLNNINKENFLNKLYELINYPKVLEYKILRDVEVIGLMVLFQHNKNESPRIIKLIKKLNENHNLLASGQSYFVMVMFQYFVAIDFIDNEEYQHAVDYCNKALDLLNKKHSDYGLYLIYYQLARSYYNMGKTDMFRETLYKCILQTRINSSSNLLSQIEILIKEDYNIDADSFLLEYIKIEKKT